MNFFERIGYSLILVSVLFSAPQNARAETGFTFGYTLSSINIPFPDPIDTQYGDHFSIGGFTTIGVADRVVFRPGFIYGERSSLFENLSSHLDGALAEVHRLEVLSKYIEIPLLLEFRLEPNSAFNLILGPSIGFVLSSEFKQDGWGEEGWAKDSDFGAVVGVGFSAAVGRTRLGVDFLYRHPLTNVGKRSSYIGEAKISGASIMGRISI